MPVTGSHCCNPSTRQWNPRLVDCIGYLSQVSAPEERCPTGRGLTGTTPQCGSDLIAGNRVCLCPGLAFYISVHACVRVCVCAFICGFTLLIISQMLSFIFWGQSVSLARNLLIWLSWLSPKDLPGSSSPSTSHHVRGVEMWDLGTELGSFYLP